MANPVSLRPVAAAIAGVAVFAIAAVAQVPTAGGVWETLEPMPDRRTEVSTTTDGQRVYVLGGFALRLGQALAPIAVHAYDPAADNWTHVTDLPVGINHAGLVYFNGSLYVIGGFQRATFNASDRLLIYDLATDQWRDGTPLPTARGALAVATLNGRIHVIGGEDAAGADTNTHEVYDPATDSWAIATPMPTPRNHHAAAAVGNQIKKSSTVSAKTGVVMAGRNDQTTTMTVNEIYDGSTGLWHKGADVPTGRSGGAAVALAGHAYLFGGEQFTDRTATFDEAERYDPATDSWQQLPDMPTARHGLGAAVIEGAIYVISGGPAAGFGFSDLNERLTPEP